MTPTTATLTLYDDWTQRRALLGAQSALHGDSAMVARVLDYLLKRYRGAAEAAVPVRSAPYRKLQVNERVLVVHQHLGRAQASCVRSRAAAENRIAGVLARMHAPTAIESTEIPEISGISIQSTAVAEEQLDQIRLKLASGDCHERLDALYCLWGRGGLHDVSLLCDLLALPASSDEHPQERAALHWTLRQLAGMSESESRPLWLTLYADWHRRRRALDSWDVFGDETAAVKQVLDHLLENFRDEPEAGKLAVVVYLRTPCGADPRKTIVDAFVSHDDCPPSTEFFSVEGWLASLDRRKLTPHDRPANERLYFLCRVRERLASTDRALFHSGLLLLPLVGDLQDIGLLCELLAFRATDADRRDRQAMVSALRRLARFTGGCTRA